MTMMGGTHKETIAYAIDDELNRQSRSGANRIDIDAMAAAVERALHQDRTVSGRAQMRDAKRPDQLNATNDG